MKIFVGWDSREDIAYQVCAHSIKSRQPSATVVPLKQHELREQGLYDRPIDPLSSTEFTFTRFLVPHLMGYKGWAVFVDCDFVFLEDVQHLFNQANDEFAVMVVQHDYTPTETVKMDGKQQTQYPRKNWSSMILWNCGHPSNAGLTPDIVNTESGAFLHRFQWLRDEEIGALSVEWNWLVNWYKEPEHGNPKAIHYTEGGPWFDNYKHCEYGYYWAQEKQAYEQSRVSAPPVGPFDFIAPEIKNLFDKILKYRVDPGQEIYKISKEDITTTVEQVSNITAFAVDSGVENVAYDKKGNKFDPILESFIQGCGGQLTTWDKVPGNTTPVVIRGLGRQKAIKACIAQNRDYYYIDTGYFGNDRKKNFHRIVKNNLQNIGQVIHRPHDRLPTTGWKYRKFKGGRSILLCPPSTKVMNFFGMELQQWIDETVIKIKQYTDRPIIVREKQPRSVRVSTDTMEQALADDVHCLVTFNSIAATEAILLGKPAFTLGPNAAQSLCLQDLSQIEHPYYPTSDEVLEWAAHLSYCQFTPYEMKDGTAWRIVNNLDVN